MFCHKLNIALLEDTHLNLPSILVYLTIIFVIRERVRAHEINIPEKVLPSFILARQHSVLSSVDGPK
jgi:hypothetical protein